ncbi:MAG: hypothetical protein RL681_542 [Candidatus Parcubacteria bacterium]|jgi:hypothetical protein
MRNYGFVVLFVVLFGLGIAISGGAEDPTTTIVTARMAERLDKPHIGTYHFFEVFQLRGRWIVPDVGYVDFGRNDYRELFTGAGYTLHDGKRVTMIEEFYFVQGTGPAADGAAYLQPWTLLQGRLTKKFAAEAVYFLYVPLTDSASVQHVIERAKLEYSFQKPWKVGMGYAAYKPEGVAWKHKPFLTVSVKTRAGAFEFWLQKVPGGAQVQARYKLVHTK